MPQSGSEGEDEAWPIEGTNERIQAANEAVFPQYPKTSVSADPVLLRTQHPANSAEPIVTPISAAQCRIYGSTIGLPGPQSQDDDEDSSPHVQDSDLEDHTSCSNCDMTTFGHTNAKPLTLSPSTRAYGSENLQRVTPASPTSTANLTTTSQMAAEENAKLTLTYFKCITYFFTVLGPAF